MNLHDFDIKKEAFEAGTRQKAVEDATNLLKLGVLTPEQISSAIGLPLEQVVEQKNSLTVNA